MKEEDELAIIENKLTLLGLKLLTYSHQDNVYYDYPNRQLEEKNIHFRFRYNTHYKTEITLSKPLDPNFLDILLDADVLDDDSVKLIERYNGEISLSEEYFEKYNDIRDQISLEFDDIQILEDLGNILKRIGLIDSFSINKERREYGYSVLEDFRNEIHIEIDTDIIVLYQGKEIFLEHTLQICKEGQSIDIANREIEDFLKKLDLSDLNLEHTTKSYLERAKEKV